MKKTLKLPTELAEFLARDNVVFHAPDGDWELRIEARDDSEYGGDLPQRVTVIAENGCGDCLFLKDLTSGKLDRRVYVYWHEEERSEVFAKSLAELIAASEEQLHKIKNTRSTTKKEQRMTKTAKKSKPSSKLAAGKAVDGKSAVAELEKKLSSNKSATRADAIRKFATTEFGLEALPLLRRALADESVLVVIAAAECIAKFGPAALASAAAQTSEPVDLAPPAKADLETQLMLAGSKVWAYSGYPNLYTTCLDALVKLEADEDAILEYVELHVGNNNPDDLIASLDALQHIGTAEARDLAKRMAAFWMPELNLSYAKKAKALLAGKGAKKK